MDKCNLSLLNNIISGMYWTGIVNHSKGYCTSCPDINAITGYQHHFNTEKTSNHQNGYSKLRNIYSRDL